MPELQHKKRNTAALIAGTLCLGLAGGASAVSNLSGPGDFAQIAKHGFGLTVDGAFYVDAAKTLFPNLQPNLGSRHNNYSWSMEWFNGLWVGTNRDVTITGLAGRDPAEIWRYTPSSNDEAGVNGLSGTWKRMHTSGRIKPLFALVGGDQVPFDLPRDIGYRSMTVCNAGDQIDRLYVTSFGLPGGVLYYDGQHFRDTSNKGLFNNIRSLLTPEQIRGIIQGFTNPSMGLSDIPIDLGYRGSACFKGRLVVAPAGQISDVDIPANPVVHINADPAHGAPWQILVNLADPSDPDNLGNLGAFQIETVGDHYIYLAVVNRTTGMQLWRGDGNDCLEPWVGDGHCNITWAKIIDHGAGRPPDLPLVSPEIDNAGATLGVYGNDLYVGAAESGFVGITSAELIRVPNAGGPNPPNTWQLIAGWPRLDFDQPGKRRDGLENLDCTSVGDVPNDYDHLSPTVQAVWDGFAASVEAQTGVAGVEPVGLDDDLADDDCLPASGAGPGLPSGAIKDPLTIGNASYLWRMAQHQGDLFIAILDYASGNGFDLIKSSNGVDFSTVFDNGLGNPNNVGGRTLLSTPIGLAVGTANINVATALAGVGGSASDGTEVFIGTTAPGAMAAPKADAGPDRRVFGSDSPDCNYVPPGSFCVKLDASASTDSFGGGGLAADPYEWFTGAVAADCATLNSSDAFSTQADPSLALSSMDGPSDMVAHTFTLRVRDVDGKVGCDEVTVTASYDQPPTVEVHTSVPYDSGLEIIQPGYPGFPTVKMIDFDGDNQESYDVEARCMDDQAKLTRCELVLILPPSGQLPVNHLSELSDTSTDPSLCAGLADCPVHARVTTPYVEIQAASARGFDRPGMFLVAEDENGYQATFRWNSLTQPIVDTDGNDAPVCRNADLAMTAGVDASIQTDPAAGQPPICVDPDGDPLTYGPKGTGPSLGTAGFNGVITYTPDDFTLPAVDQFSFFAEDPAGASSAEAALRVTVADDPLPPKVTIDFPSDGGAYLLPGYLRGCSHADICGTAFDAGIGLAGVEVAIQRDDGGAWWNGAAFVQSPDPIWHAAEGTATWTFNGFIPSAGGDYRVLARATDTVGNAATATHGFSYSLTLLQRLLGWLRG